MTWVLIFFYFFRNPSIALTLFFLLFKKSSMTHDIASTINISLSDCLVWSRRCCVFYWRENWRSTSLCPLLSFDLEDISTIYKVVFVSRKLVSGKLLSKLSCVCLPLEKLVNRKHFPVNGKHFLVKEKFSLVSRKIFSFYFGWKTFSGSCEKFRSVILFAYYIKFGPQTFDYYIYFVLNICFSISSLRI
jgi:hypothetical protein